jgi:hypothetical protein
MMANEDRVKKTIGLKLNAGLVEILQEMEQPDETVNRILSQEFRNIFLSDRVGRLEEKVKELEEAIE